ncbi:MAG TPA: hypothetical protein VFE46_19220 [Pirellulales bacterium]|jgi:hypothetical protein|nr:hypothetical protein [Pirellulales bacterium]
MIPHPIRLQHPWDELPGPTPDRVLFRRRFNSPAALDTWERVSLEIDRAIFSGEASLNGTRLAPLTAGQFFSAEVTSLLKPANELLVEVDKHSQLPQPPASASVYVVDPHQPLGSPIGDVRLVIRTIHPSDNA